MSKTVAVNAGSSSLKWQLYEMPEETVIAKGVIDRIGLEGSSSTVKYQGKVEVDQIFIEDHKAAVKILLNDLIKLNIIKSYDEITGVGHRVVAGGKYFDAPVLITDEVIEKIDYLALLAPLHNHANAEGIRAFKTILPDIVSVAVFDTAFHTTLPDYAYRYPIPNEYYEKYGVRKYGAHGMSHYFVSREAAKILGKPVEELKLITAHIGNGVSLTAIDSGKSVDTSMGFTPLGGVMMGTRSGDLDPAIIPYLLDQDEHLSTSSDLRAVFNRDSGLLGISENSNDMRDIYAGVKKGDYNNTLAYNMFADRLKKFIGQYFAVLNGADAIVFTAGMAENEPHIRAKIIEELSWFGVDIDPEKNQSGVTGVISTDKAKVAVLVVPTDEELVIARDVEGFKS